MAGSLVLIASYPKSGNTWTRAVLQGLLHPESAGQINRIDIGLYGAQRRHLFDRYAPAPAADLTPEEIERFMPAVYEEAAMEASGPLFLKVHDLARQTSAGEWLFPPHAVRVVFYLVRHPFDVAASFSHHLGYSMEETVRLMGDENYWHARPDEHLPYPLQEHDGSWSSNVASWLSEDLPYKRIALRYEDLRRNAHAGFRLLAEPLNLPTDHRLTNAVEAASFERLQAAEKAIGFRERPASSPAFFRAGRPMSWRKVLPDDLKQRLICDHACMMQHLGYQSDGSIIDPPHSSRSSVLPL